VLDWFGPALTSYDRRLATTWATSVERLSPESRRLLDRLAMLAPDPIPDSLLDVAVPGEVLQLRERLGRKEDQATYAAIPEPKGLRLDAVE